MVLTIFALFVALTTIVRTDAFNNLTPWDQEVTYNWKALVKAGTHLPAPYASQFALQGKIHLQSNNNSTFVKITDLTYQLYNGILDHVHEHQAGDVPLPQEVQDLNNVFKIVYDTDGLAIGIVTEADEKDFSRNIKKAIATILQMKKSVVDKVYQRSEAFVIKENSIYGHGLVDYTVVPLEDDVVEVLKMHDMPNSYDLYSHYVTNTEFGSCDANLENMVMHDSMRKYIIAKENNHHIVKEITASGAIVNYPFKAQSDSQYISVNQTFIFVDVVPVQQQFHIEKEHFESDLRYHTSEDGVDADLPSGRRVVNYDKLIPLVQEILKDIPQYLQENHINTEEPDSKRGQLVNRVQRLLIQFTIEKLEELQKTLPDDALKVFYHILPLVGTDASTMYIKNLIVKKLVDDDLAVTLLQHMSDNLAPSTDLLSQLEELIHLDTTFKWNVRKVAILAFGSLVHKSYIYTKKDFSKSHMNHDESYEKYVNEYISNLKNSEEYKIQMVHLLGLYNMKLPSLIKHLVPIFKGEEDENLRLLALWSASGAIMQSPDPNTIIETLWPTFTNRTELTELRVLAYYYIMQSQPSHSRLRNIFSFFLSEPNYELWNFHYTYMQTVMQSTNPCRQEIRVKLAQVMKLTSPPIHGNSSANFYNYKDTNYGFGAELEHYFVNAEQFHIHVLIVNSQHSNTYQQEYLIYFKVRDNSPEHPDSASSIFETLLNFNSPTAGIIGSSKHIEAAIVKRGQVLNVFYLDESNIRDAFDIISSLKRNTKLTKDWLSIDYRYYTKVLIPTDLGIPAQWEFLMPDVHQNKLTISLDVPDNEIVNLHVENKYVNWLHYRHGLSFYNPISDVWQGVNRFHAYDVALPINFDLTLKTETAQLSWKRKNDTSMNIAGLRSHVKQMVFIENLYDQKDLLEASPQGKNFQIVSHGKQYRHDYTLLDEDNLDSGHKWYMGIYDSDLHVSNGNFKHQMYLFAQSNNKQFNSPIEHLLLTLENLHRYLILMPLPGTHGFIFKIEPSHKYPVSNIDMTLNVDKYSPRNYACHLRWIYAVKNKDQRLKTWNLNVETYLLSFDSIAQLNVELIRTVDGQEDYQIFAEVGRNWQPKNIYGGFSLRINSVKVINGKITGQSSLEQQSGHYKYKSCQYVTPYSTPRQHTSQCLASHTTLRHYILAVETANISSEVQQTITSWWDHWKTYYHSYYAFHHNHDKNISDNSLTIDIVFPMQEDEIDIHVTTPQHMHEISGIPARYWSWFGLSPDSVAFPRPFKLQHDNGWLPHCRITRDHLYSFDGISSSPGRFKNWVPFIEGGRNSVFLKEHANNTIVLRVADDNLYLEILPEGGSYQISLNGRLSAQNKLDDWIYYRDFTEEGNEEVGIITPSGFYVSYNAYEIVIFLTSKEIHWRGQCFGTRN